MTRPHCPVCSHAIDLVHDPLTVCGDCRVPYHRECMAFARRCAIYGCGWKAPRRREAPLIGPPSRLDALILDNARLVGIGTAALIVFVYMAAIAVMRLL